MDMEAGASARLASAYARAIEGRDPQSLASMYAEDCEHVLINRNSPPGRPTVLRGRAAVAAMWQEVAGRDNTHRVESMVTSEDRIAWHVSCQNPDGTRVVAMGFVEIVNGLIQRESTIDCWDE